MQKYFKKHNTNLTAGFSLVEMLVAIGIFMTIATIAISSLISIIGANKKAQLIKTTIDNVTFAVENMSKDMRMGTDYKCSINGTYVNDTAACSAGSESASYINSSRNVVTYKFYDSGDKKGSLTRTETCVHNPSSSSCGEQDLISPDSNVNISDIKFFVLGADNESNPVASSRTQPRVIITASGQIAVTGSAATSFNLQTSVSQRARLK
jgi:type II secretory pathway pseudopilin PulG